MPPTPTCERDDWERIVTYENGKRDMALTISSLFERSLPDDILHWLRVGIEMNDESIQQATDKIAAIQEQES